MFVINSLKLSDVGLILIDLISACGVK